MRLRSKRAWLLPLLATILSVLVVGGSLTLRFLDLDTYKARIIAEVRQTLKRDLHYETGDFSFRYGPAFSFTGVSIKEKNGVDEFIRADRLTIRLALIPLLRKELVLSRMLLERPILRLSRDRAGVFNVDDLVQPPAGGAPPAVRGIELKDARITFSDAAVAPAPLVTELTDTDLYLSQITRGKTCDFKFTGKLKSGNRKVPLFAGGVARLAEQDQPFGATEVTGRFKTGGLDAGYFWPYYSRFVPFKSLAGELELQGSLKGRLSAFKLEGDLQVSRLRLDYPQVFHSILTPRSVKASCKIDLSERNLEVSSLKANVDGLQVTGSCRLSDIHSGDPRITAKAVTNRFNLRDFRPYIPYGVIVKDVADFIERKIPGGVYRLEDGRLDGRVSQILHMERGDNYKILVVRAHVDDGIVNYGGGIPVFTGIKGELALGRDFTLTGMSGKFGASPFTLDGRITDYCLDLPTRYLFTMNLHPLQGELAWFLGHGRGDRVTLSEGSLLKLSGAGTTSLYQLTGEWDLTKVAYSYPDLVSKPGGRPNSITFRGTFDKEQFRLQGSHYALAPLSLSATAVSRYGGEMSVELKTNQFPAAEVSPFFPAARKYQPTGRLQADLSGKGAKLDALSWGGEVSLSGFAFKPGERIKQVSGVNGSLRFNGDSLESSQLSAHLGNSVVSGRGSLSNFKSPSLTLSFSSPLLDLADLGFSTGAKPLRAERVQGTVSLKGDNLQIASLAGQVGKTVLQVKGSVQDLKRPKIDVSVTSPHLELEDLAPILGAQGNGGTHFSIKAQVSAAEGRAKDLTFQHLKSVVMLEDKILYLQPLDFSALDGEISARARVDFGGTAPRYQVNLTMQKVASEKLLRAVGVKRQEMTGAMFLQGDLSAKGENLHELKQTALGAVKLKVEHGSLRKFSTLSKVFSILNVSQLLKFQLPDMVSGGMPFNRITGDFAFRDGIASTQNLLIDSNAINISTIGKFDLVRDQLDLTIGVQPLQTVDKVVSHIPIVGWILTGKDKSLVTTYFEAKGPIEDPKVTAVPVKSMAKGVLNIFKRVFELPAKLFTDTGEVIINK